MCVRACVCACVRSRTGDGQNYVDAQVCFKHNKSIRVVILYEINNNKICNDHIKFLIVIMK